MFVIAAAVLFGLGFIINATGMAVPAVLSPMSLLLLGLTCLALHHAGYGPAMNLSRGRVARSWGRRR